jgi:hypothetical protein
MPLVNCPECQYIISDNADFCVHCGYPISKIKSLKRPVRKKKHEDGELEVIDPRFPTLPEKLGIGKRLSIYPTKFNFEGEINSLDCSSLDFMLSCKLKLSIHEYGLRISEIVDKKNSYQKLCVLNLHFSLVISVKQSNLLQAKQKRSVKTDLPLDEQLFCGTTYPAGDDVLKFFKVQWQNTPILVINYWNTEYKYPTSLIIRGSSTKISKFINSINSAKLNFDKGIPNVPDKKGDKRYILKMTLVMVLLGVLTILTLKYFMS